MGRIRVFVVAALVAVLGGACVAPPVTSPLNVPVLGYMAIEVYDGGVLVEERGGPAWFRPAPIESDSPGGLYGDGVHFTTTDFTTDAGFVGEQGTYRLRREMDVQTYAFSPPGYTYRAVTLTAPDQVVDFDGFEGFGPSGGWGEFQNGQVADPGCPSGFATEWLLSAPTVADPDVTVDVYWGYCTD